jgi:hypothetical protein
MSIYGASLSLAAATQSAAASQRPLFNATASGTVVDTVRGIGWIVMVRGPLTAAAPMPAGFGSARKAAKGRADPKGLKASR